MSSISVGLTAVMVFGVAFAHWIRAGEGRFFLDVATTVLAELAAVTGGVARS